MQVGPAVLESVSPGRRTRLDRVLSLITEVRAGEGVSALLLAANLFTFLALYYVLRPVRASLILSESGAVAQSYSAAGQAALLLVLVPAYGALASRVSRVWLIGLVTLFFASNLVVFYVLGTVGWRLGIAFYIWLGVFNLMVPAQMWAFANDIYTEDRGKRLFPLIGIGSSLGAWVGATVAAGLFASLGPYPLMLIAAGSLLVCLGLTIWIKVKQAIDGFFWRAGDLLQAVVVFVGTALAFQTRHYGLLNLAFVGVWLIIVGAIVREHRKLIRPPIAGAPEP